MVSAPLHRNLGSLNQHQQKKGFLRCSRRHLRRTYALREMLSFASKPLVRPLLICDAPNRCQHVSDTSPFPHCDFAQ